MDINNDSEVGMGPPGTPSENPWLSFHFYYHGDRSLLLMELVCPLLLDLYSKGWIDRFFFIRYGLGGPHIRLRLRLSDSLHAGQLADYVSTEANVFFTEHPSLETIPEQTLEKARTSLSATDPAAASAQLQPDNSVAEWPFEAEVERYGGPEFSEASMDFFQFSSLVVLEHLIAHGHEPQGKRIGKIFRLLIGLAYDLSASPEEWQEILAYIKTWWNFPSISGLIEKGQDTFVRQSSIFSRLLAAELAIRSADGPKQTWQQMGLALRHHIRDLPLERRLYIMQSHLHMTANRLGLNNAFEVYVGAITLAATQDLLASEDNVMLFPSDNHPTTWPELFQESSCNSQEWLASMGAPTN